MRLDRKRHASARHIDGHTRSIIDGIEGFSA
jgi:hypothetical protein